MMFKSILFATLFATAAAEVTVDAAQKKTLLSKARKLENKNEEDMSWLAKFSVKFVSTISFTYTLRVLKEISDTLCIEQVYGNQCLRRRGRRP